MYFDNVFVPIHHLRSLSVDREQNFSIPFEKLHFLSRAKNERFYLSRKEHNG